MQGRHALRQRTCRLAKADRNARLLPVLLLRGAAGWQGTKLITCAACSARTVSASAFFQASVVSCIACSVFKLNSMAAVRCAAEKYVSEACLRKGSSSWMLVAATPLPTLPRSAQPGSLGPHAGRQALWEPPR